MTRITLRRLLALTATTGLAAALAACGPDDAQQNQALAPLLSQAAAQPGWSMDDLAEVDPAFLQADAGPLPRALPMRASYGGDYNYAPAYDYGPEPYYDDGYYEDDPGAGDYQWLALASALGGMLGNAPPDYGFGYDGVQPWAWETGDRYLRYAEPIDGGYRYYYYEPDSYAPFLVSDPYYSYGYRDDRLVVIYDRSGRVIDARRAERQRQAARDYYARARQMYVAAHREPRVGVAAPLWQRHRDEIARQPQLWQRAKAKRTAWQQWDAKNQPRLHRDWAGEALVRREAERGFSGWQKADFKTPPPKLYSPQRRQAQLQKVAEIRRRTHVVDTRRAQQRQVAEQRRAVQRRAVQQQQQAVVERGQQARREADVRRVRDEQQVRAKEAGRQRQAQAQRAKVQQRAQAAQQQQQARKAAQQKQAQAQRAKAQQATRAAAKQREQSAARQRQQQAERATQQHQQQALRAASERRRQAAREHQLEAQRATKQRRAQREAQQQAERATQQRQAQQAQQARRAAQQQAERAAQQKQQAQARQAAQREAQQARAAQKQASAPQARQPQAGDDGHGKGRGRKKA